MPPGGDRSCTRLPGLTNICSLVGAEMNGLNNRGLTNSTSRLRVYTGVVRQRKYIWDRLRQASVASDVKCMKRFQRVPGFGLDVSAEDSKKVVRSLRILCRRLGWSIHVCKVTTKGSRPNAQGVLSQQQLRNSLLLTWNINSWSSKRIEISAYVRKVNPTFVALQETVVGEQSYPPRLNGYTCLHKPALGAGERGVALAIKSGVKAYETTGIGGYLVAVKAFGIFEGFREATIVASLYFGKGLKRTELRQWLEGISSAAIIAGDFNMDLQELGRWISKVKGDWSILATRGASATFYRSMRSIDHVVVNRKAHQQLHYGQVDRTQDLSDHWPMLVAARRRMETVLVQKEVLNRKKVQCGLPSLLESNVFYPLLSMSDPDELCAAFVERSKAELRRNQCYQQVKEGERKEHLGGRVVRAVEKRRRLFRRTRQQPANGDLKKAYLGARKEAKKIVKHRQREMFDKWVEAGCKSLASGASRDGWLWLKKASGKSNQSLGAGGPVLDADGKVLTDPAAIKTRWVSYFKGLQKPDEEYTLGGEDKPEWEGLNNPLSWTELQGAVFSMGNWKAAGDDELPAEFYKAIAYDELGEKPASKALLHLLQIIFEEGVPDCWKTASVVPIPKKGDMLDPNNYRPIALINVGLKLLCKVLERRLTAEATRVGAIRREQFGFRRREEAISLRVFLQEIAFRRRERGFTTFITFLDLKKAYDSVPISLLLKKLQRLGIRGQIAGFLTSLYRTASAAIRVGGEMSEKFACTQGVRQGDPLSPLLFNLFINDMFDELAGGVPVGRSRVLGGMFADDVALVSSGEVEHQVMLNGVFEWARRNGMEFSISKCGSMTIGAENVKFTLGSAEIPSVDSYLYLGIPFDKSLEIEPGIRLKVGKVKKLHAMLFPFLGCQRVPCWARVLVFKACIMGAVSYGGELFGFQNCKALDQLQTAINGCLRTIVGTKSQNTVLAMGPLLEEFQVPTIREKWDLAMLRAVQKWPDSVTYLSEIFEEYPASRKWSWLKRAQLLLAKVPLFSPRRPWQVNLSELREVRGSPYSSSLAMKRYNQLGLTLSVRYLSVGRKYSAYREGIKWLLRARCYGIWTSARAGFANLVSWVMWGICPICENRVPADEQFAHLLAECPCDEVHRIRVNSGLLDLISRQLQSLSVPTGTDGWLAKIEQCLLGGALGGSLIDCEWLVNESQNRNRDGVVPHFLIVSRFLGEVMPLHQRKLWSWRLPTQGPILAQVEGDSSSTRLDVPTANARPGTAVSIDEQPPVLRGEF
jgi:exonuclease III